MRALPVCAAPTSPPKRANSPGLAEQREAALDVRGAMSPTIGCAYPANSYAYARSYVSP